MHSWSLMLTPDAVVLPPINFKLCGDTITSDQGVQATIRWIHRDLPVRWKELFGQRKTNFTWITRPFARAIAVILAAKSPTRRLVTSSQEEVVEALAVSQATKVRIENPSWSISNQLPCDKQSAQPATKVDT
jgi:hypothetical protein